MKKKLDSSNNLINQADINEIFSQVTSQEVEQFYKTYQLWLKHQQIAHVQQRINQLREKQAQNTARMNEVAPSAVSLSTLAQLRASGVEDVDLLDRMLERGEEWLDHTMELLERCEDLNVIRGNYTQWCEHALEGAYEWMGSMDDASLHDYFHAEAASEDITLQAFVNPDPDPDPTEIVTEDQLLRKLMSDDSTSTKKITVPLPRITQELSPLAIHKDEVQALSPLAIHENETATTNQNFPVEIEEPASESIEIDAEEQARISAEQQRYQEKAQVNEPDEHLEDLFPIEIAEPALSTEEIVERAQLLPVETTEDVAEITPAEAHESPATTKVGTDAAVADTPTEISAGGPVEAVETIDVPIEDLAEPAEELESAQPVNVAESQPEAVQTKINADAPASEENEPVDNLSADSSTVADILTDAPTEQASSSIDTETVQDDTQAHLILEPPPTEPEEETLSEPALNHTTEIAEAEETTHTIDATPTMPEEDASSQPLEISEPVVVDSLAAETTSPTETTENRAESTLVEEQESAPVAELDTPTMTADTDTHVAVDSEAHTTPDTDANEKEEPAAQWPFVYQEIEDTPLSAATPAEAVAPVSAVKKQPAATKQTKKKPRKEASRKVVKKKLSFIRRLLARFFRR